MPFYIRFGVGPLRFSQRLGQTQAQKRAAAKREAQARAHYQSQKRHQEWAREYYSPERVAEREARDARTYRAVISECRIDPLTGGSFTVTASDRDTLHLIVPADWAMNFLSLRNRDVIQVTVTEDGLGVEGFLHLARANGATPRNPVDFSSGFPTTVSEVKEID